MPSKVSIIVPVYNAERYLRQCLDSITGQTLREIEIICINDGSTDSSPAILEEYARKDPRFILIHQNNSGPAAARNAGIEKASGEYLAFLDADDFFAASMLEKMYSRALKTLADITVCLSKIYDDATGRFSRNSLSIKECPGKAVYSYKDIHGRFDFLMWWAWDKLFKKAFIDKNDLRFQDIPRYEDAYFVLIALYKAERITVVRNVLALYRAPRKDSLSATQERAPASFYKASRKIRAELEKMAVGRAGDFSEVLVRYTVWVVKESLRILGFLAEPQAFAEFYRILQDHVFREYTIDARHERYFDDPGPYEEIQKILSLTPLEYLFISQRNLKRKLLSPSYRIGRSVTWLPRKLREVIGG
jgi:glycosyltransferase involved in cell wall biosynthesis